MIDVSIMRNNLPLNRRPPNHLRLRRRRWRSWRRTRRPLPPHDSKLLRRLPIGAHAPRSSGHSSRGRARRAAEAAAAVPPHPRAHPLYAHLPASRRRAAGRRRARAAAHYPLHPFPVDRGGAPSSRRRLDLPSENDRSSFTPSRRVAEKRGGSLTGALALADEDFSGHGGGGTPRGVVPISIVTVVRHDGGVGCRRMLELFIRPKYLVSLGCLCGKCVATLKIALGTVPSRLK